MLGPRLDITLKTAPKSGQATSRTRRSAELSAKSWMTKAIAFGLLTKSTGTLPNTILAFSSTQTCPRNIRLPWVEQRNEQDRRNAYNVGHSKKAFVTQMVGGLLELSFHIPVMLWQPQAAVSRVMGVALRAAKAGRPVSRALKIGWRQRNKSLIGQISNPALRGTADAALHGADAAGEYDHLREPWHWCA